MAREIIKRLLAAVGGKYSRELGIDLTLADPAKWITMHQSMAFSSK